MATFRCRSISAMAKRKDFTARPCSDVSRQGDAADCSCSLSDRIETYSLKEITPAGASDATYRYSILVDVSCARRRRTVQRSSHRLSSSHRARTGRCSCCAHARRRRGSARGWRSTRRRRGRAGGGGETGSRRRRSRRRAHHQGSCGRWGPITHNRRGALLLPANQPGRRTSDVALISVQGALHRKDCASLYVFRKIVRQKTVMSGTAPRRQNGPACPVTCSRFMTRDPSHDEFAPAAHRRW